MSRAALTRFKLTCARLEEMTVNKHFLRLVPFKLCEDIYLLMDTSASFTQSTMVCLCRCTACVSTLTTFARVFNATYRMLLSLFPRNLHQEDPLWAQDPLNNLIDWNYYA